MHAQSLEFRVTPRAKRIEFGKESSQLVEDYGVSQGVDGSEDSFSRCNGSRVCTPSNRGWVTAHLYRRLSLAMDMCMSKPPSTGSL